MDARPKWTGRSRISFVRQIVDLHHCQGGYGCCARKGMRRRDRGRGYRVSVWAGSKNAEFAAVRPQQLLRFARPRLYADGRLARTVK